MNLLIVQCSARFPGREVEWSLLAR